MLVLVVLVFVFVVLDVLGAGVGGFGGGGGGGGVFFTAVVDPPLIFANAMIHTLLCNFNILELINL